MKDKFILLNVLFCFTLSICGCGKSMSQNIPDKSTKVINSTEINSNTSESNDNESMNHSTIINKNKKEKTKEQSLKTSTLPTNEENKEEKDNTSSEKNEIEPKNDSKQKYDSKKQNKTNQSSGSTSSEEVNWYYVPRNDELPPRGNEKAVNMLKKYNAYYLGDTSKKVIYLTFDEGYENGFSSKILDILKANNVKAAFFVTTPYITSNKDLIKRMVNEGHLVCNHSTHHPSMASITDIDKFNSEFTGCAKAFKEVTDNDMPKFFRPPMGKFSETSLKRTNDLGYKTIFWSFAYRDWEPAKQPSLEKGKKTIMERVHPGAIYLLHAVSKTNTEILDDSIKQLKNNGYTFESLNTLPKLD